MITEILDDYDLTRCITKNDNELINLYIRQKNKDETILGIIHSTKIPKITTDWQLKFTRSSDLRKFVKCLEENIEYPPDALTHLNYQGGYYGFKLTMFNDNVYKINYHDKYISDTIYASYMDIKAIVDMMWNIVNK